MSLDRIDTEVEPPEQEAPMAPYLVRLVAPGGVYVQTQVRARDAGDARNVAERRVEDGSVLECKRLGTVADAVVR